MSTYEQSQEELFAFSVKTAEVSVKLAYKCLKFIALKGYKFYKNHHTEMTMKELLNEGKTVSSIPVLTEDLKVFRKQLKDYGIHFTIVHDANNPDLSKLFFQSCNKEPTILAVQHCLKKIEQTKGVERPSLKEEIAKLQNVADMAVDTNNKMKSLKQEQSL